MYILAPRLDRDAAEHPNIAPPAQGHVGHVSPPGLSRMGQRGRAVAARRRAAHPMRGSRATPLGFTRSRCRMVTHVSPAEVHTKILSLTRSTK